MMALLKLATRTLAVTSALLLATGLTFSAAAEEATTPTVVEPRTVAPVHEATEGAAPKSESSDSVSPAGGVPDADAADSETVDEGSTFEQAADSFVDDAEQLGDRIARGAEQAVEATKRAIQEAFE